MRSRPVLHAPSLSQALVLAALASLAAGCGGAQEHASAAPPPVATVAITVPEAGAPAPPPPPAEPSRLQVMVTPTSSCLLTSTGELTLDIPDSNLQALHVSDARARMGLLSTGDAFVEATTSAFTVRGYLPRSRVSLRSSKWISFGGVFYPGYSYALPVASVHDANVVLDAPALPDVALQDSALHADVACSDVSPSIDPAGALAQDLPPIFQPKGQPRDMVLKPKKAIPLSAEPTGPAVAAFQASDSLRTVTVLEQSGKKARVRLGHVAGWVDQASLTKPDAHVARDAALREAAEFGMIGLYSNGVAGGTVSGGTGGARKADAPAESPVVYTCKADVRLVTVSAKDERVVVGSIPAGFPVRVVESGPELLRVEVVGLSAERGARLTVPARDVAGCNTDPAAAAAPPPAKTARATPGSPPEPRDAIELLDAHSAPDDTIGLGMIGTLGTSRPQSTGIGTNRPRTPSLRQGTTQVTGRLPPEVIQRIVRQNFGRFRLCYENGLRTDPNLAGTVKVKFEIDATGAVKRAADGGSDLHRTPVVSCVVRAFGNLSFPQPESGSVQVVYPIIFSPGAP